MRRKVVSAVLVMAIAACAAAADATPGGAEPRPGADLAAGYLRTAQALHDIEVVSSKEYTQLPWVSPVVKMRPGYVEQDPGPYYYRFVRSGGNYGWWFYGKENRWKDRTPLEWTVFDGKASLHVTDTSANPDEKDKGRAIRTAKAVDIDVAAGSSLLFTGSYNGADLAEALAAGRYELSGGPTRIGELDAQALRCDFGSVDLVASLCPSRSFLPVFVELYQGEGLISRREFSDFEQLGDGTWFPHRMRETHFNVEKGEAGFKTAWKVTSVVLAPEVCEKIFDASFDSVPEGFTRQEHPGRQSP